MRIFESYFFLFSTISKKMFMFEKCFCIHHTHTHTHTYNIQCDKIHDRSVKMSFNILGTVQSADEITLYVKMIEKKEKDLKLMKKLCILS